MANDLRLPTIDIKPLAQPLLTSGDQNLINVGGALQRVQERIDALQSLFRDRIEGLLGDVGGLTRIHVTKLTLSANTTLSAPGVANGFILLYMIRQAAAGGPFTVTWDVAFRWDPAIPQIPAVGTAAGKLNSYWYYKETDADIRPIAVPLKNQYL